MKKILLIVVILLTSLLSICQVRTTTPGFNARSNSFAYPEDYTLSIRNELLIPRYDDTVQANVYLTRDTVGSVIFTYDSMSLWVRKVVAGGKRWQIIGSGSGGGGGSSEWGLITGTLSNQTDLQTALNLKANLASPTFTGTVVIPSPFTLGGTSVTSTGTQLNYLNAATGTTGTASTNIVYSTSPLFTTPRLASTSTIGHVWTATDGSGNGSFQVIPVYTASEGLQLNGSNFELGGSTLVGAASFSSNRYINLNRKYLQIISGAHTTSNFDPVQINIQDTMTSIDQPSSTLSTSALSSTRNIVFNSDGLRSSFKVGHVLRLIYQGGDSSVLDSDGGDFAGNLFSDLQFRPKTGTLGKYIFRGSASTLVDNEAPYGTLSSVSILNSTGSNYAYLQGWYNGQTSYLLMNSTNPTVQDTIENFVFYGGRSFVPGGRALKVYYLHPSNISINADSVWFLHDHYGYRSYHQGNMVIGYGAQSSNYTLDVNGTSRFSDSSSFPNRLNVSDSTGFDVGLINRSTGLMKVIRFDQASSLLGAGNVSKVGTPVDNQVGIWTGDGTIEGVNAVQYNGTTFGIGGTMAASAILDLTSTTQGFLTPRLNTTQQDAISTPATGLLIYNTDSSLFRFYNGAAWTSIAAGGGGGGSGTVTSVSFTGGLISVATATTTPALTVAGTSGGIPYFSSTSTWASSGALTASAIVLGGGAGAAPTSLALGTANQMLGMNSGATAHEYKTFAVGTAGTNFTIDHSAGAVTFNLPDASATARGVITTGAQSIAGVKTTTSMLQGTGGFSTATNIILSNFSAVGINIAARTTNSQHLFGGAAGAGYRISLFGSSSSVLTANDVYAGVLVAATPITEAASGTHAIIAGMALLAPTVTGGSAATTDMATLYINGAPSGITPTGRTDAIKVLAGNIYFVNGNVDLGTAGNKLNIATGSNASIGVSGAMTAGSITISTTAVTASSIILLTHATLGGTQGILSVGTITAGTSFVINSSSALDTGTVNWFIIN